MNPFDQFDTPTAQNPFDQFDNQEPLVSPADLPLKDYISSLGGNLTKEKILGDERLMGTVRDNLRTRFGDRSLIAGGVTSVLGGATADYTDELSNEEAFEMWQNYHRSFAGGQTVTTANELAYITKADDATKAKMAEGYELFDSMGNIFTGDGTWSETFDGVRDYITAGVWDPTTVASFGIGRAFTTGGSKAAAVGIKEAAKLAAEQATRQALVKGLGRGAAIEAGEQVAKIATARGFLQLGGSKVITYGGFDAATAVLADAGYQAVQQDVGRQENWNYGQSALAALGVFALPAMMASGKVATQSVQSLVSKSPNLQRIFANYEGIVKATAGKSREEIEKAVRERIDLKRVNENLRDTFYNFMKNKDKNLTWDQAKMSARALMEEGGVDPGVLSPTNKFFDTFLFGGPDPEQGLTGLVVEAARAGFVYVQRSPDDKVTNWIGDLMSWVDDDVLETAIKSFDEVNGTDVMKELTGLGKGSLKENVVAAWKITGSEAGYRLLLSRKGSDLLGREGNFAKSLLDELEGVTKPDKEVPAPFHYVQSVWKRLMTAHPGTTGLNVKGWAMMSLSNTVSDFALGVVNYGQAAGSVVTGRGDAAKFVRMGNGAILSSVRRGFNLLNIEATLDEAKHFFDANPKIAKEVFRELAGDVGAADAPKRFNMNENNLGIQVTEKVVRGLQQISGVMLQDEVTKQLSFMANLDRALLRKYGKTYSEFMTQKNAFIELRTKEFAEIVAQATDRTLRETASKSWANGSSQGWPTRMIATGIENFGNTAYGGYIIPFGRFFNTSMAFFGDFTMLNYANYLTKKAFNKQAIDPLNEEGAELLAKGVVGLSAVAIFGMDAVEKINQGLAWNQELEDDGTVKDTTYDFPESFFRAMGQVVGHVIKDGEVPAELWADVGMLTVGQTFRAGQESVQAAVQLYEDLRDPATALEGLTSTFGAFITNIISGMTRPLDPINQLAAMLSDEGGVPDRRQSIEALRYVDQIPSLFGVDTGVPKRATPTRGTDLPTDMGRVLGGVRSTQMPNPVERVFNSIGTAAWREVKWDGDPKVKNRMDEIIDPLLNTRVMAMLEANPDFFDMPLELRQMAVDSAVKAAVKDAKEIIKIGVGGDKVIDLMHQLGAAPKAKVRKVLEMMGVDVSLEDLAEMPGAEAKLETLLYMVKNYDEIIGGAIK